MEVQVNNTDSSILAPFAGRVQIPDHRNKIFKDECFFSFESPECECGLYVCMEKFYGFGREHVENYHRKTGRSLFLHLRRIKRAIQKTEENTTEESGVANPPAEKVSRLAIGVEGGFDSDSKKYEYEDDNHIVLLPGFQKFKIDENLPTMISMCADAIIKAESAARKRELEDAAGTWEGEQLVVSKYAENLEQLDNGVKVPPRGWKCSRCDKTDNLWMNLTDGSINCGRKNFDGSGGNNHAVDHYAETKYPLAVKLGTITSDGKADVFSYAEDNMVLDPFLKKHLAHFGINVAVMEKTEKSMVELEIDVNKEYEFSTIAESGAQLVPIFGPGYTGMQNLGNTCYMNSVMQVLFTIPNFQDQYVKAATEIFESTNFDNTGHEDNFQLQMAKLGCGLMSGAYSVDSSIKITSDDKSNKVEYDNGVKPVMFKNLIGRGHPEFSGKQQQDAQEFYLHVLNVIERENKKIGKANHAYQSLQFKVEDRLECGSSNQVSYSNRVEDYLPLPIPLEKATNEEEFQKYEARKQEADAKGVKLSAEEVVRRTIPFHACLERFCSDEIIEGYLSPVTKEHTYAKKTTKFRTFPDHLMIQLKKFDIDKNWQPYKLDVEVDMPDIIDLSCLYKDTDGLQPGEIAMPEGSTAEETRTNTAEPVIVPDQEIVRQLTDMGFSLEGCKKAAFHTKNAGVEAAMNWVLEHSGDPDFNFPFVNPSDALTSASSSGSGTTSAFVPDEESVEQLINFGFTRPQCVKALKCTNGNMERAADWLFNHPDDTGEDIETDTGAPSVSNTSSVALSDGSPRYKLVAFISHMGTSTNVGHYVCHILKEGRWVIYNDEKVALSEKTPKKLGYLYMYERIPS